MKYAAWKRWITMGVLCVMAYGIQKSRAVDHELLFPAAEQGVVKYTSISNLFERLDGADCLVGLAINTNYLPEHNPAYSNSPMDHWVGHCWWNISGLPAGVAIESAEVLDVTNSIVTGHYSKPGEDHAWINPVGNLLTNIAYEAIDSLPLSNLYNSIRITAASFPNLYDATNMNERVTTNMSIMPMHLGVFAAGTRVGMGFTCRGYTSGSDVDVTLDRRVNIGAGNLYVRYAYSPVPTNPVSGSVASTNSTFSLQWSPTLSEEDQNLVYEYQIAEDIAFQKIAKSAMQTAYKVATNNATTALIPAGGLPGSASGKTYYWRVRLNSIMTNVGNASTWSTYRSFDMFSQPDFAPQGVYASDKSYGDKILLRWLPVAGATSYRVFRAANGETAKTNMFLLGEFTDSECSDTSAPPHSPIGYYVAAVTPGGESVLSAKATGEKMNNAPYVTQGTSVSVTMSENGTPTPFALTLNGADLDGDSLHWDIQTQPQSGGGTASLATTNGAEVAVQYAPPTNSQGFANFQVRVRDGYGGSGECWVRVVIKNVNNRPVLTPVHPVIYPISADDVDNSGFSISSITTNMMDPDGDPVGVALFAQTDKRFGHWEFSTDNKYSWNSFAPLSTNSALLLRGNDWLRFQPNGGSTGTNSVSYYAWDANDGSAGSYVPLTDTNATSAFSELYDTATLVVEPTGSVRRIWISTPLDAAKFTQQEAVQFEGSVDNSSNQLPIISTTWWSSFNGIIGSGLSATSTNLAVGTHTITFKGADAYQREYSAAISISILGDTNGDGLPDEYENQYWPDGDSGGSDNDYDQDGVDNKSEFVSGTDPTSASSVLRVSDVRAEAPQRAQRGENDVTRILTYGPIMTNRVYQLYHSPDMKTHELVDEKVFDEPLDSYDVHINVNRTNTVGFFHVGVQR